jgi:hypothetical protein
VANTPSEGIKRRSMMENDHVVFEEGVSGDGPRFVGMARSMKGAEMLMEKRR